jgi:probable rRNA maturation factor
MRKPRTALPVEIAVLIQTARWRTRLPAAARLCRRAARAALARVLPSAPCGKLLRRQAGEISIVLASNSFIAKLNRDFRGKRGPTNVLSFSFGFLDRSDPVGTAPLGEEKLPIGDVVIALETVVSEAKAAGIPLGDHLAHLTVHGILHLLGFDHERKKDAVRMEAVEVEILDGLGIPDPYHKVKTAKVA